MKFTTENIENIPKICGIYILLDDKKRPIYIGKSENVKQRMREHHDNMNGIYRLSAQYQLWKERISFVRYFIIDKDKLNQVEKLIIWIFRPPFNITFNNNTCDDERIRNNRRRFILDIYGYDIDDTRQICLDLAKKM